MRVLAENLFTIHWPTLALSSVSLAILLLWPRTIRRVPGSIVCILAATPQFRPELILPLLPSALSVGVLLVAAPLARYIPLGTLAAVLFIVAYNMGE